MPQPQAGTHHSRAKTLHTAASKATLATLGKAQMLMGLAPTQRMVHSRLASGTAVQQPAAAMAHSLQTPGMAQQTMGHRQTLQAQQGMAQLVLPRQGMGLHNKGTAPVEVAKLVTAPQVGPASRVMAQLVLPLEVMAQPVLPLEGIAVQ